jgi:hypothetical protein
MGYDRQNTHMPVGAHIVTLGGDRRHIRRRNKADKYCLISFNDHKDVTLGNSCASLPG